MKRFWKILIAVAGGLLLLCAGGFAWFLMMPPKPAPIIEPGPTGRRVVENDLFANYFLAPGPGRKPAILLLGGSEGGLGKDVHREAILLQKAGFNVLQAGYFNVPGKPGYLADVPLEAFFHAIDWLKARPESDPGAVGIVGYSKGAEAALLVAAHRADIQAVVAGMPSSVVWGGMSMRSYIFGGVSSWSVGGKPVPSLDYGSGEGKRELLPRFVNALKQLDAHPDTIIPVERFGGKLLLVCGERDTLWPACPMARQIVTRVRTARPNGVELLAYPEAGHGVMGAPLPASDPAMRKWAALGGTAQANAAARSDSWSRIVAFLDMTLKRQVPASSPSPS